MKKLYLSASRIKTYLACPRQYRLRYVDRIKMPQPHFFLIGTATHRGVEMLHRGKDLSTALAEAESSVITQASSPYDNKMSVSEITTLVQKLVTIYSRKASPWKVSKIEEDFEIEGQEVTLTGVLDSVLENYTQVGELKTSGKAWPQNRPHTELQATVYAYYIHFVKGIQTPITITYRILVKPTIRPHMENELKNPDGKILGTQTKKWNDMRNAYMEFTGKDIEPVIGLPNEFSKLDQKTAREVINRAIDEVNKVDLGKLQELQTTRTPVHYGHLTQTIQQVGRGINAEVFPRHISPGCAYCDFRQLCLGEALPDYMKTNGSEDETP